MTIGPPTIDTRAAGASSEAILDFEFEVTADDPRAIGRAFYHGRRSPTLIMAIVLGAMALAFYALGSWPGTILLGLSAVLVYANPKMGSLDRWFARRQPGNRIGTEWRFQMGTFGIDYWGAGLNGHIGWEALRDVHIGDEAIAVIGADGTLMAGIPTRVLTPWQLTTFRDLVKRFATNARILE